MDKLGTILLDVRDEAEWSGTNELLTEEFGYRVVIVRSPAERAAALRDIHIDLAIAEDASGFASSMYYGWSKEFLEAGKRRLAGDTARAATSDEVKDLRREAQALKEVVADLTLENRLLKKSMNADGGDEA